MISALKQAMISVDRLEDSVAFYKDIIGFEVILESDIPADTVARLWDLPEGMTAEVVVLAKSGIQWGQLRLVQFSPKSKTIIREKANNWDPGIFDIAFLGEDATKTHGILKRAGIGCSEIGVYDIPDYDNMRLREILAKGLDGVAIAFLHYDPPYKPKNLKEFSEVLHSVVIVADMQSSLRFYGDVLEMDPQTDMVMDNDTVRHIIGTPKDTVIRMVSLKRQKGFTGRIMLFQFLGTDEQPLRGTDFAPESIPPNIGLCLLAFDTDDIDELESRFKKNDIEIVCAPRSIEEKLFGHRRVMTVKSPEGTLLEFAESDRP